ncbi:MAG: hypothetical protein Kow0092_38910 [Deferrisomatales bacterium]
MATDVQTEPRTNGTAAANGNGRRGLRLRAPNVRVGVARLLHWSDQLVDRAVGFYDRLVSLDEGELTKIHQNIAVDLAKDGKADRAIESLRRALALRPDNAEAWFHLGLVHLRVQASAEALEALDRARELGVDAAELHYRRAEALADLDRHEEAVEALRAAAEKEADWPELYYRLGVSLDHLKRYEEAVEAFERAIELDPREVAYYQSLGFTMESMGRHEQAVACFKRAVDLERRIGA